MNTDITKNKAGGIAFSVLTALSLAHFLNDTMQSILFMSYPTLKTALGLSLAQVGLITLFYQFSASVFQPIFGYFFDKKPMAWYLPLGMCFTMCGLVFLSLAPSFPLVLLSVMFCGVGSSVLHPEASRLTSIASGGRRGLAQSVFQVGGSTGYSIGPILAALFISPYGQRNIGIFALLALFAIIATFPVCRWYSKKLKAGKLASKKLEPKKKNLLSKKTIVSSLTILLILIFSKYIYLASISSFFMFYLIEKFSITETYAQIYMFAFLFAGAMGTLLGGPIGDKIGRRYVIWVSIMGTAPFALLMPYANLFWTLILAIIVGLILSSAFSAILVYAQELLPSNLGFISGLFFGLAFGIAGISSAILGKLADIYSLNFIYHICSFMPLLGIVAYFLPTVRALQAEAKANSETI